MNFLPTAQHILATLGFHGDVTWLILLFSLAIARLLSAIVLAPFLGGQAVPGQIKVGLAIVMAAVLSPYLAMQPPQQEMNAILVLGLLAKEVMIGTIIGLITQFVFLAVQTSGVLMDTQRGMNQMSFFAPQLPGNTSVLSVFQFQAAVTLFVTINGHLIFLKAMHDSFERLPVLTFPHIEPGVTGIAYTVMRVSADMFVIAFQISAPVLLTLFMIDVAFGAIGRIASQIHVHNESQPVKALAGLGVLFLSIGFTMTVIQRHMTDMLAVVQSVIRMLR